MLAWMMHTQHPSCFHKVKHLGCRPNNSGCLKPNRKRKCEKYSTEDKNQPKITDILCVKHTCVFNVFNEIKGAVGISCIIEPHGVIEEHSVIKQRRAVEERSLICVDGPSYTFLTQISHEELKTNEGENSESKDGQNHDVHHFLYRLDQSGYNGFQT